MIWLVFYLGGVVAMVSTLLASNEKRISVYLVSFVWFLAIPTTFINLLKRGVSNG